MSRKVGRFLLLYGSQTGQAQAISEEIEESAPKHGLVAERHCLSLTEKKFCIEDESCVVFVVSTTGDGEPPDTMEKFWRRLKKRSLAKNFLKNLRFALLGLGDSNYSSFCVCSHNLEKRLVELGATKFYDTGFADDAVGIEVVAEPWLEELWPALLKELKITTQTVSTQAVKSATAECGVSTAKLFADMIRMEISAINKSASGMDIASDAKDSGDTQGIIPIAGNSIGASDIDDKRTNSPSVNLSCEIPSLTTSVEPLNSAQLIIPTASDYTIKVKYLPTPSPIVKDQDWERTLPPFAISSISHVPVVSAIKLTKDESVKKVLEISIDIQNSAHSFLPGDSIGIFAPNDEEEVRKILNRLNLTGQESFPCKIVQTLGKKLPKHIPPKTTLYSLFSEHCDIRSIPKKKFLRILSTYASEEKDKRRLEELSSRQGADDYTKFVINPMISLLDLLIAFPSCQPPVECILENIPALQPRYYSIANSPMVNPNLIKFVFNVVEIPAESGRSYHRLGVSTGWLQKIAESHNNLPIVENAVNLENAMQKLSLSAVNSIMVPMFMRKSSNFHLPSDNNRPIILIGSGTGIAPFVGFLEHRCRQKCNSSDSTFGDVWLFYGCRHKDHDFLYKDFLQQMIQSCILTQLYTSFSRDSHGATTDGVSPKYVQDNIRLHKKELTKLIHEQGAMIYICGDAKGMAQDVKVTLLQIFQQELGLSESEAQSYIRKMQDEKRYLLDVWT